MLYYKINDGGVIIADVKCEHEGVVGLDHIIRCRLCGITLDMYESQITKTQSAKRAKKIIDEIAVKGGFTAARFDDTFVVYEKHDQGIVEEITAIKEGDKEYKVIKRLRAIH